MTDETRTEGSPATSVTTETTTTPDWRPNQWGDTRQMAAPVVAMEAAQDERTMTVVLSDESVDSYGTIFKVSGWRALPPGGVPLLLFHDRDRFPAGRIERIEKGTHNGKPALLGHARFAPAGIDPDADKAYAMAKARMVTDVSVGFHPHNIDRVPDQAERKRLGLPPHGVVFTDTELLEGSLVGIGANKGAKILAVRSANNGPMEPGTISGGNEDEPSLRELVMLQIERLEVLERAVQALGTRDIGGSAGPTSPKAEQAPRTLESVYALLLDKPQALTPRSTDVRHTGPGGTSPRLPHSGGNPP